MSSTAAEELNKAFNWGNKAQAISDLRSSINALEENLVRKRKELMRLTSSKVSAFTEDMLETLAFNYGVVLSVNSRGITYIDIYHGLNFLDARLQERIRNSAVFFTTPKWYATQIELTTDRVIKVKNTTVLYEEQLINASWGSPNYVHPHATGSSSEFTSICTGNNPWRSHLKEALTVSDFMSALVKASIWANSANMPDMYDEYMYKEVCPTRAMSPHELEVIKTLFKGAYEALHKNELDAFYAENIANSTWEEDYWLRAIFSSANFHYWYTKLYAAWLYIHRDRLSNSRKSLRNALLTTIFYTGDINLDDNIYWLDAPKAFYDLIDDKYGLDFLKN